MLPGHPLLCDAVVVRLVGEAQLVVRVVVLGQVAEDGEALEDGEVAAVMVDDGGNTAVWTDGCVPGLLLRILHDVDRLPCVLRPIPVRHQLDQPRLLRVYVVGHLSQLLRAGMNAIGLRLTLP